MLEKEQRLGFGLGPWQILEKSIDTQTQVIFEGPRFETLSSHFLFKPTPFFNRLSPFFDALRKAVPRTPSF